MFSVELLPDPATEAAVREDWARLVAADLSSSGRQDSASHRPHVTLAVREQVDPRALEALGERLPLPLDLGGVVLFGHRRHVLARAVVPSLALLRFQHDVADAVGPPERRYVNTAPDRWTPHVTLARRLDGSDVARALAVIAAVPTKGQAVGLRVWDAAARRVTTIR